MPRLHTIAETKHFNYYDCLFSGLPPAWERKATLFGDVRIPGLPELRVAEDVTHYILNWYARTNIPPSHRLDAWALDTSVELLLGEKPVLRLSMFDLLRRREGDRMAESETTHESMVAAAAHDAYEHFHAGVPEAKRDPFEWDYKRWYAAAEAVMGHFSPKPAIIVPVRQRRVVEVTNWHRVTLVALEKSIAPGSIEPRPALWVHLEGFTRRDAC